MVKSVERGWTQEDVRRDFTHKEGRLYWLTGPRSGKIAGWVDGDGYTLVRYKGVLVRAHNLVWLYYHDSWPCAEVDHINNDPTDNSIGNLRLATRQQNGANQKLQARREGKYKGVYQNKTSYYAKIKYKGKQHHIGSFKTEKEAALAYNKMASFFFGNWAKLNEVD